MSPFRLFFYSDCLSSLLPYLKYKQPTTIYWDSQIPSLPVVADIVPNLTRTMIIAPTSLFKGDNPL